MKSKAKKQTGEVKAFNKISMFSSALYGLAKEMHFLDLVQTIEEKSGLDYGLDSLELSLSS